MPFISCEFGQLVRFFLSLHMQRSTTIYQAFVCFTVTEANDRVVYRADEIFGSHKGYSLLVGEM